MYKWVCLLLWVSTNCCTAQEGKSSYAMRTIAFYNVENLFDTTNDSLIYDDDRTPDGKDEWTIRRYLTKVNYIAKVLSQIGPKEKITTPDIIGVCEIENSEVLRAILLDSALVSKNYSFIHSNSPDRRGIDVALLYKKDAFIPVAFQSRRLVLQDENEVRKYTRDQLVVSGFLDGEAFSFIVNHWPSRSGGEAKSRRYRIAAAKLNKRIIDSLVGVNPNAKIISMGDFNDDPIDHSFRKILRTNSNKDSLSSYHLHNPMEMLFKKGIGSLAYRDEWNLFDQFFFTTNLLNVPNNGHQFWKAGVFAPSFLKIQKGKYKGYPFRTYAGGVYTGGYSDHFPVYMCLLQKH